MKRRYYILGLIFIFALIFYLLALSYDVYRIQRKQVFTGTFTVYVFSYGWHSGLVLDQKQIPSSFKKYFSLWPQRRYLEVSWGDNLFYRNQDAQKDWFLALRALIWPTNGVLHIVGFNMPPNHIYRPGAFRIIYLSSREYWSLMRFVTSYFVGDSLHSFVPLQRGLYGDSYFLKSKGVYEFPFTCNVWTAQALKAAGFPITPVLYQIPGVLLRVLRETGKTHYLGPRRVRYVWLKGLDAENRKAP